MIPVSRLGHATLHTERAADMMEFYTAILGLRVLHHDARFSILGSHLGEETIMLRPGAPDGCGGLAFQLSARMALDEAATQLRALGIAVEFRTDPSPAITRCLRWVDLNGTAIDLFTESRPGSAAAPQAIGVLKLGHVAHNTPDVQASVDFYTTALGFRVSDWMADFFAFLRCGPEHHTVNFLARPARRMHHLAFELRDRSHLLDACEWLGRHRIGINWGPGRHGIGHNLFVNFRDPDGHLIELYAELDLMLDESLGVFDPRPWHRDRPQRPKIWDPEDAALIWGTQATADFMRG